MSLTFVFFLPSPLRAASPQRPAQSYLGTLWSVFGLYLKSLLDFIFFF